MAKEREEQEPLDIEEVTGRLEDLLHGKFRPAGNEAEADTYYTTEQIYGMVDKHAPDLVPRNQFREAMLKLGFVERVLQDEFVWLMRSAA